jgi:hypothetical protein
VNRTGQQGADTGSAGPARHQVRTAMRRTRGCAPHASSLAIRLVQADNGSRGDSPSGRSASRCLVGLAWAISGAGQAGGQLRRAVRLVRRTGRTCGQVRILLGVYVLGGLRGAQEARVATHLAGCARCRAEYEELAEVPALLDMLTSEEATGGGELPAPAEGAGESAEEPATQADAPAHAAEVPRPLPLRPRTGR